MFVYADNAATTKPSQVALDAMLPCLTDVYGNPSSLHSVGQKAAETLQAARETVAACLGCQAREIYFTSGGSEADNQAIVSAARLGAKKGKKHIISTAFEHHAVLHTLKKLEKEGFEVELLPVGEIGTVTAEQVKAAIRPDTCLVTIMYANNEIGSILPIAEIGAVCKEAGVLFHTDAVQAAGHLHINVQEQNIDMLSLSGAQVPRAEGRRRALLRARASFSRTSSRAAPRSAASARAPKTSPASSAWPRRWRTCCDHIDENAAKVSALRDKLIAGLAKIPHSSLNGDPVHRLPGNVNFCFEGIEGESLLLLLDDEGHLRQLRHAPAPPAPSTRATCCSPSGGRTRSRTARCA